MSCAALLLFGRLSGDKLPESCRKSADKQPVASRLHHKAGVKPGKACPPATGQQSEHTNRALMVAALLWQAFPVPLADQGVVVVCPLATCFKIIEHTLFRRAERNVGAGHLPHADEDDQTFKHAEQLVNADGILLRTRGKFLIKGVLVVHDQVVVCAVFLNGQQAGTEDIFKWPVVLLCCFGAYLLNSIQMVRETWLAPEANCSTGR